MHSTGFISILVLAADGKPLREHDHKTETTGGSSRVTIPPNTEYRLRFKNQLGYRRRVRVSIDGTEVFRDLIIPAYGEVDLERFQNSDRKFKAVVATDPQVQDPTAPQNGTIQVQVWTELSAITTTGILGHPPVYYLTNPGWNQPQWTSGPITMNGVSEGFSSSMFCQTNLTGSLTSNASESMATVEGSKSDQQFTSVHWMGDSSPTPRTFTFQLVSPAQIPYTHTTTNPQWVTVAATVVFPGAQFCHHCGQTLKPLAHYCSSCGKKL
jgi:hypothetical protein